MKKILLTIISGMLAASGTFAQDAEYNYEPYPYGFISLQGGAQATFTNVPFTDLITPIGAVSVGGFFLQRRRIPVKRAGMEEQEWLQPATVGSDVQVQLRQRRPRHHAQPLDYVLAEPVPQV